ncbi:MAG: AmmeMemoRadiSam system protein B [Desulfosudaceae bacterium]
MDIRQAVFAGSWYPGTASECQGLINSFLNTPLSSVPEKAPVAVVVPHAGWVFSGGIAGRAIALLRSDPPPDTVIVFGMHLPPEAAPRLITAGGWETPLGVLPVDVDLAQELARAFDGQTEDSRNFSPDNTIELQLPFIKHFFKQASIVPIGVPPAPVAEKIGRFAAEAAGRAGKTAVVIGSTDLTHYGPNFGMTPYGTGQQAHERVRREEDRRIIDRMVAMEPQAVIKEGLASGNACCAGAAAAAIAAGRVLGADSAMLTEYATSYDMSPGDSFVGYAGVAFY